MSEWLAVEAIVRQRDKEKTAHAVAKLSSESGSEHKNKGVDIDGEIENDVFEENDFSDLSDPEDYDEETADKTTSPAKHNSAAAPQKPNRLNKISTDSGNVPDEDITKTGDTTPIAECCVPIEMRSNAAIVNSLAELSLSAAGDPATSAASNKSSPSTSSYETVANDFADLIEPVVKEDHFESIDVYSEQLSPGNSRHAVIITDASVDIVNMPLDDDDTTPADSSNAESNLETLHEEITVNTALDALQEPKSACVSPASSNGGIYSVRQFESIG